MRKVSCQECQFRHGLSRPDKLAWRYRLKPAPARSHAQIFSSSFCKRVGVGIGEGYLAHQLQVLAPYCSYLEGRGWFSV